MDKGFLMGRNDGLTRSTIKFSDTFISPQLKKRLLRHSIECASAFFASFLGIEVAIPDVEEYESHLAEALRLRLFQTGGVKEKDHIALWCLSKTLNPDVYIESGVFIGSSLHAFLPGQIVAIDPHPKKLRVPGVNVVSDKDFSQLKETYFDKKALVFFDDHVNTADRIIQSAEKGIRYVLFDDSTGLEGVCQRLYPATPTLPMITNCDLYQPGDELSWTYKRSYKGGVRLTLHITEDWLAKCHQARKLIKRWQKLPEIGESWPQNIPEKTVDTSKFIVELTLPTNYLPN